MEIIGNADGPTSIYLSGVLGDSYQIITYTILIIFYSIYFLKQYSLKRHGIQAMQLGQNKIEILILFSSVCITIIQIISIYLDWSMLPSNTRFIGIILGLLGDLIFFIAVLTMKNSWRAGIPENACTKLITNGIYKYSRNPAFLAFDLIYISILLIFFNIFLFLFTSWTIIIFHLQILQEEKYLEAVFKDDYIIYKNHTYRYFGRKK